MARVTVVGAGVVGLTCAVRLLEDGHRVDVLARDLPLETTSAVAAAIWYPYRALPFDRVLAWSARSYEVFVGLADVAGAGVALRGGVEVFATPQEDPWWRPAVPHLDHVEPPPRLRRRVDVPGAGRRDAGLPGVADVPDRRARRHRHPAQPARPARGRRRGRQRGGHRCPAPGRGPVGRAGERTGRVRRAGRSRAVVARLVRRPHLRRTPLARHRRRRHRPGGRLEPYAVAVHRRGDPGARSAAGARPGRGPRASSPGGPAAGPPLGAGGARKATSCTATATAAPASP